MARMATMQMADHKIATRITALTFGFFIIGLIRTGLIKSSPQRGHILSSSTFRVCPAAAGVTDCSCMPQRPSASLLPSMPKSSSSPNAAAGHWPLSPGRPLRQRDKSCSSHPVLASHSPMSRRACHGLELNARNEVGEHTSLACAVGRLARQPGTHCFSPAPICQEKFKPEQAGGDECFRRAAENGTRAACAPQFNSAFSGS